ncbi:hypothetical protein M758_12G167900 [Ceratodon purpureus]|nr:hypothetical protein M758_12G167900 [Ceratodon purpureus]
MVFGAGDGHFKPSHCHRHRHRHRHRHCHRFCVCVAVALGLPLPLPLLLFFSFLHLLCLTLLYSAPRAPGTFLTLPAFLSFFLSFFSLLSRQVHRLHFSRNAISWLRGHAKLPRTRSAIAGRQRDRDSQRDTHTQRERDR